MLKIFLRNMPFVKYLLNILKLNVLTYDWFCADGSHIYLHLIEQTDILLQTVTVSPVDMKFTLTCAYFCLFSVS